MCHCRRNGAWSRPHVAPPRRMGSTVWSRQPYQPSANRKGKLSFAPYALLLSIKAPPGPSFSHAAPIVCSRCCTFPPAIRFQLPTLGRSASEYSSRSSSASYRSTSRRPFSSRPQSIPQSAPAPYVKLDRLPNPSAAEAPGARVGVLEVGGQVMQEAAGFMPMGSPRAARPPRSPRVNGRATSAGPAGPALYGGARCH